MQLKSFAAGLVFLLVAGQAIAGDLWLDINLRSYHFDRTQGYNENNLGLGLEYRSSENLRFIAGEYRNSFRDTSWYAGAAWFTDPYRAAGIDLRAGIAAGIVTGYYRTLPLLLPAVSFERGRYELNITYAPKSSAKASALMAAQIGIKF